MVDMTEGRPVINIEGEGVALGPMRRDLLPTYHRWQNDFFVRRSFGRPDPLMLEQGEALLEEVRRETNRYFTIYERETWAAIGLTYLEDVNWRNRTAEFGLMIGETTGRGRGYGTETTRLVLDYAFTALGLHNVMLEVFAYNLAGKRAYEKAGFHECGRRHESRFMGGKLWDRIFMECLATEFTSPVLARVLAPDVPRERGA